MINALVTGGAGFIGSHLVEELHRRGIRVTVLDDLSTGDESNVPSSCSLFKNSVLEADIVTVLVAQCDIVFHLAAVVGVQAVLDYPLRTLKTNVRGTENVLEACARYNKPVLIASSSEVYGKPVERMQLEDDDIVYGNAALPRWSYAASKLIDEHLALAYHRVALLPVVIARLFNTSGPRQTGRYGMVIPRFVQQALTGVPITVHGDGMQTRTFTHVRDTVVALARLMENTKAAGQIVNVGGIEEVTILDLAERVKARAESDSPIEFVQRGRDDVDMMHRHPATWNLKRLTGFVPMTPLDVIIDDVIAYQRRTA